MFGKLPSVFSAGARQVDCQELLVGGAHRHMCLALGTAAAPSVLEGNPPLEAPTLPPLTFNFTYPSTPPLLHGP